MEIKEKMYVRTKEGIGTIHRMSGNKIYDVKFNKGHIKKYVEVIGEPSYDLIDLIEVGDYVNGKKVNSIKKNKIFLDYGYGYYFISTKLIEDIVTHEQFENMEYKVEE